MDESFGLPADLGGLSPFYAKPLSAYMAAFALGDASELRDMVSVLFISKRNGPSRSLSASGSGR